MLENLRSSSEQEEVPSHVVVSLAKVATHDRKVEISSLAPIDFHTGRVFRPVITYRTYEEYYISYLCEC